MPKTGNFFQTRIAFDAQQDLMDKLISISYLRGSKGVYSPVARDLLTEAVERHFQSLGNDEKGKFRQILEAVRAGELVRRAERDEKRKELLEIKEPSLDLQEPSDQDRGQ